MVALACLLPGTELAKHDVWQVRWLIYWDDVTDGNDVEGYGTDGSRLDGCDGTLFRFDEEMDAQEHLERASLPSRRPWMGIW